ncbi:MAG: enoyl-CoA hydratase/isomerase family protein, partial [bacterium]|nr:enoyl-CoA hydratase/isomerase family protein [bacterium]
PLLVVDATHVGVSISSAALQATLSTLTRLACPSIILGGDNLPEELRDWLRGFDVALPDDSELPLIEATVAQNPIASLAMVQLLRHSGGSSIHEGLIAESLVYSTLQSGPEFANWLSERKPMKPPAENNEPAVALLRDGAILNITFDRPERRNAFSAEMRDGLVEALHLVSADPSLEEVVLRGAGPAFCSGGDLYEFGTFPDPATAHVIRSTRNPARALADCADRVRSEVHGACVGAGVELPAFTHRVRAHPDAFFWLPEVAMGLVPGAGGSVSLPRRIGHQKTNYLALTGRKLDAETALAWGLVDELG